MSAHRASPAVIALRVAKAESRPLQDTRSRVSGRMDFGGVA